MTGRVAVVGAGSSGIAATKVFKDAGFTDIVCFERRDVLGGLWYFSEEVSTSSYLLIYVSIILAIPHVQR